MEFEEAVYEIVKLIPKGRVTTYGAIAKCLGCAKSSRMVGYALNRTKNQLNDIPAHRVVNRKGLLTGKQHFESNDAMEKLLNEEGVLIKNNQVQNFEELFWEPRELVRF